MQKGPSGILTLLIFAIGGAAMWFLSSAAADHAVENEAGKKVERARRLLAAYDPSIAYQDVVIGELAASGAGLDSAADLPDSASKAYQDAHSKLWASFTPTNWPGVDGGAPRQAPDPQYGNIDGEIDKGLGSHDDAVRRNEDVLDAAIRAADEALNVSVGGADARSYGEAHRLKAIALFHKGMSERTKAVVIRQSAQSALDTIVSAGNASSAASGEQGLREMTQIEAKIEALRGKYAEADQDLSEAQAALRTLEATIDDFETRIADYKSRRAAARERIGQLQDQRADLSDPQGVEKYRQAMAAADREFRSADRAVQVLESGDYPNATIDSSGDYLIGRYVENGSFRNLTTESGLSRHQNDAAVLRMTIATLTEGRERMIADIRRLEALQDTLAAREDEASRQLRESGQRLSSAAEDFLAVDADAAEIEDGAIRILEQSAAASKQAANAVAAWVRDAGSATSGMSPAAQDASAFSQRSKAGWMGGHVAAQEADARLAIAGIHLVRYSSYTDLAAALEALPAGVQVSGVTAGELKERAQDEQDAGVDAVTSAIEVLKTAHRTSERHWTFVAQLAAANHMVALLGDESFRNDAIESLRNALKGREGEAYVARLEARLRALEASQ